MSDVALSTTSIDDRTVARRAAGAQLRLDLSGLAAVCRDPRFHRRQSAGAAGALQLRTQRRQRLHHRQLPYGLRPLALHPGADQHPRDGRRNGGTGHDLCGAAGLGVRAHGHAAARVDQAGRARRLHHAALPRRGWVDTAGGPQLRLDQQGLDGRHRRHHGHRQCVHAGRADPDHGLPPVLLHLRFHLDRARAGVVGDGGRCQHPGRRHRQDGVQDNAAARLSRHPRRHHYRLPAVDRAIRRAGADRYSCTLSGRHHAAVAVLRISRPRRGGCRLRAAAAGHHHAAAVAAEAHPRPQGLHHRCRQGWRAPHRPARSPGAGSCSPTRCSWRRSRW